MEEKKKPQIEMLKCKVCAGHGDVNWGKATCHACQGKGYILIRGEEVVGENGGTYDERLG